MPFITIDHHRVHQLDPTVFCERLQMGKSCRHNVLAYRRECIEKNGGCLETRMIGHESRERARDVYFYSGRYFARAKGAAHDCDFGQAKR